jgi:arylsulfatase A-like enzyme
MGQNYQWGPFKKRPNILFLMTDQERSIQHFPEGWADKNLPALTYLKNNGLEFTNAYANTSPCSPSRAMLFTGLFPSVTNLYIIGETLPFCTKTVGYVMEKKGYKVAYKGKWHLTHAFKTSDKDPDVLRAQNKIMKDSYRLPGWTAPEISGEPPSSYKADVCAATTIFPPGLVTRKPKAANTGVVRDKRIVKGPVPDETDEQTVMEFLDNYDPATEDPFFLVVSLKNPHDIVFFPEDNNDIGIPDSLIDSPVYKDFIAPPNCDDNLENKPVVQKEFVDHVNFYSEPLDPAKYLKFYALCHTYTDSLFKEILDTLDSKGLKEDTIIFRLSDHGEMAMSHQMRAKCYNMYQETMQVPIVVSNPKLVEYCYSRQGAKTPHLVSLVDVMPTLAEIAGWTTEELENDNLNFHGNSFTKTILDPTPSIQDYVIFTAQPRSQFAPPDQDSDNIRAVFNGTYKYGVYYNYGDNPAPEYEMYNIQDDPYEKNNLLYKPNDYNRSVAATMFSVLENGLKKIKMLPDNWKKVQSYQPWESREFYLPADDIIKNREMSDTRHNFHMVDNSNIIQVTGQIISWEIWAENISPVQLVIYNSNFNTNENKKSPLETPKLGHNVFSFITKGYSGDLVGSIKVNPGNRIGWYYPGVGCISYSNEGSEIYATDSYGSSFKKVNNRTYSIRVLIRTIDTD